MKSYLEITTAGQFRRPRAAALDACRQFGVDPVEIRPLNHGENTTFRVTEMSGTKSTVRITARVIRVEVASALNSRSFGIKRKDENKCAGPPTDRVR